MKFKYLFDRKYKVNLTIKDFNGSKGFTGYNAKGQTGQNKWVAKVCQ